VLSFFKKPERQVLDSLFNTSDIYFVNQARTGLRIALNSLGLPAGSRVGVLAFNCHSVFQSIENAGFKPVFIDINRNFQLDIQDLQKKTDRIDVLVVTHLFGIPADIDLIKEIVSQIPIIEDCAHSFQSTYKGKPTGSLADIGVFSIGNGKFPAIGNGGFIVVNNKKYLNSIHNTVGLLKGYSFFKNLFFIFKNIAFSLLHNPYVYGFFTKPVLKRNSGKISFHNSNTKNERKIPQYAKYLFLQKITSYRRQVTNQQESVSNYNDLLNNTALNNLKSYYSKQTSNCFMLPIIVDENPQDFINNYSKRGVEVGTHFSESIEWARHFGYVNNDCPETERMVQQIVVLPTYIHANRIKENCK
jgi:dTDP-4-amino-4,6-dideoxygalactose transaminase